MSHIKGNTDQQKGKLYQTKTVSDKNIPSGKNDLTHILHLNKLVEQSSPQDLKLFLELDVPHLSAYNLILEEHTMLYLNDYKIKEDIRFDKLIDDMLTKHGYKHYEISNYARHGYESIHNKIYWYNEAYFGFGLGAVSYIDNNRISNHFSM